MAQKNMARTTGGPGCVRASRRALQAITFHKRDGVVLRAIDPIERDRDG
jgi:hypothetical protein